MSVEPKSEAVTEVKINGRVYCFCTKCSMYGEVGWTHVCGLNWYPSVEELDEATSTEPPFGMRVA